jgi:pre-mRNA-splicing factor ATP-dependent RNA helicase DHX15/PRP43
MDRKRRLGLGEPGQFHQELKQSKDHGSDDINFGRWPNIPILNACQSCPYQFKDKLMDVMKKNQIVVIEGDGEWKTTQIPQFIGRFVEPESRARTQPRCGGHEYRDARGGRNGCRVRSRGRLPIRFKTPVTDQDGLELPRTALPAKPQVGSVVEGYRCDCPDEATMNSLATDMCSWDCSWKCFRNPADRSMENKDCRHECDTRRRQVSNLHFHNAPLLKVPGRAHPVEVFYITNWSPIMLPLRSELLCIFTSA